MKEKPKCWLCGRKAEFFGHIHFLEREHVWYFCGECMEKAWRGKWGPVAAISIWEKLE